MKGRDLNTVMSYKAIEFLEKICERIQIGNRMFVLLFLKIQDGKILNLSPNGNNTAWLIQWLNCHERDSEGDFLDSGEAHPCL